MIRRARPLLGTLVEIGVTDINLPMLVANQAINQAFARIACVQQSMSFHSPESELTRLNRHPGQWVVLSPLTIRVLRLAKAVGIASDNRFNCTVGGALVAQGGLPNPVSHEVHSIGESAFIHLMPSKAMLAEPVLVTLDGIAKGFAIDVAVASLKAKGITSGWVNAGGDLRVFGNASLSVTIRGNRKGEPVIVSNQAIASSQIAPTHTESFPAWLVDGSEQATITSAYQRQQSNGVVTVSARYAWRADALTKIAALAPNDDALMQRLKGKLLHCA